MNQGTQEPDWKVIKRRQRKARIKGEEVGEAFGLREAPVDPLWVASQEHPMLKVASAHFGDSFDGQLEYHSSHQRFLLFYNLKYEIGGGECDHVRTRFSVAHELGHYYLPLHREFLLSGGASHQSNSEFSTDDIIESEADCFAAGLLTPSKIVSPILNRQELSFTKIVQIASIFNVSVVSTAITCMEMTHFPCALIGIRNGKISWQCYSDSLIEAGCYPNRRVLPNSGISAWTQFISGSDIASKVISTPISSWCSVFGSRSGGAYFNETYFSVPIMGTLLVLLTADEKDLSRS